MAKSFAASVQGWSQKAQRNTDLVVRESVQDLGEVMTRRVDGITRGAPFKQGFVPVDTGELIASQEVAINGGVVAKGDVSYQAVVAGIEAGDVVQAVFTAPHGRRIEYGWTTSTGKQVPGRFFVRNAVQNWGVIVAQNAARFKD